MDREAPLVEDAPAQPIRRRDIECRRSAHAGGMGRALTEHVREPERGEQGQSADEQAASDELDPVTVVAVILQRQVLRRRSHGVELAVAATSPTGRRGL